MIHKKPNLDSLLSIFPAEFIHLSEDEQKISVQIYRLLAEGEPVPVERVAQVLGLAKDFVENILQKWPGVFYDGQKRIIGYWGLALPEMAHRFLVNGQTLYTWCAWDSLFIPAILQQTAEVESTCAATGEKIRLTVSPEGVTQVNPVDSVVSFVTSEAAKLRENVIVNFCHYVHFFSSVEAANQWVSKNSGTFVLSLAEAFRLGRMKNSIQYQKKLDKHSTM